MSHKATKVAYIGLGNMGSGMARNIVLKANLESPVLLFNRSPARAERLLAQLPTAKARIANSIREAVTASDVIFLSLGDESAVINTIKTMLESDVKGKVIVDCSTIARDTTAEISKMVEGANGEFVACPVFGPPAMAWDGTLVGVPAGPAAAVDKILPLGEGVMFRGTIPFRDQPANMASALKCIGNGVLFNAIEALAEGHVLSEKSGVGSAPFQRFIEFFYPGYIPYAERMLNGAYHQSEHPPFSVDHARKDIRFAKNLAKEYGVPVKAVEVADEHYAGIQRHMDGEKADVTSLYGAVRKESGLKFET